MNSNSIHGKSFTSGKILYKNSIINLIGMALPLLVGVVSIPFAIRGLGKEAFGILSIGWVILGYFGLFDLGISRATTKFVSEKLRRQEFSSIPAIIWISIIFSIFLGIIGALVLFSITTLLTKNILNIPIYLLEQSEITFYILALSIPFILCTATLRGVLEASQRFDLVNFVGVPTSVLSYIIPSLSYFFNFTLPIIILIIIITRIIALIIYFKFCTYIFPNLKKRPSFVATELKKLLSFGGWVSITNIISPILVYIDRFFIGIFLSMTYVTYYTAPYEVLVRLRIVPSAFMNVMFPEFSALSTSTDQLRLMKLFSQSVKYILIFVGVFVTLIIVFTPQILKVWLGMEFVKNSATVLRILAIGVLINSVTYVPFSLLQGVGHPELPAKFHIIEFPIYCVILYLLIKSFGIIGVSFAWTIRVILDAIFLFSATIKIYPNFKRSFKWIIYVTLWLSISGLFIYYLNSCSANNILKIIFLLIIMIISIIILLKYILSSEEKELILSILGIRKMKIISNYL